MERGRGRETDLSRARAHTETRLTDRATERDTHGREGAGERGRGGGRTYVFRTDVIDGSTRVDVSENPNSSSGRPISRSPSTDLSSRLGKRTRDEESRRHRGSDEYRSLDPGYLSVRYVRRDDISRIFTSPEPGDDVCTHTHTCVYTHTRRGIAPADRSPAAPTEGSDLTVSHFAPRLPYVCARAFRTLRLFLSFYARCRYTRTRNVNSAGGERRLRSVTDVEIEKRLARSDPSILKLSNPNSSILKQRPSVSLRSNGACAIK